MELEPQSGENIAHLFLLTNNGEWMEREVEPAVVLYARLLPRPDLGSVLYFFHSGHIKL